MEPASLEPMLRTWFLLLLAIPAFANIVGVDSRRSILDRDKRIALDLTDADGERFGRSTGYIDCRGRKYANPELGSAALVESEDLIVTNAHLVVDERGRFREPMEECFFQPQNGGTDHYALSFAPGDFEVVTDWPVNGGHNDYAVIRLTKKVEGAKAFPVARWGFELAYGMSFVAVSAIASKPSMFNPFYPVIQGCQVRKIQQGNDVVVTTFLADCDIEPGQSGSVNLVNLNGEWTAFGMVSGMGPLESNGLEYSVEKKSYSFHVAFQDKLLSAIKRLKGSSALTSLTR